MRQSLSDLIATRFACEPQSDAQNDVGPADHTHHLQLAHRSHRRFKSTPVSDMTLQLLFSCAMSAPSKSDLQQTSIIHLESPAARAFIAAEIPSMPWISSAPVFLLFCGDSRRARRVCEMRGTDFAHDPLDAFLNAASDTAMVLQNFIIAAEAKGLGCCPVSAVREITPSLADFTNLPSGVFPLAGLCLGYTDDTPAVSVRLPLTATIHKNSYDDSALEAVITDYDRRRGQVNSYKSQRQIDVFGTAENYGWSTDKARQISVTDRLSFTQYVKTNGFDI